MQKGQIVKKQLSNGNTVGPYWIIIDCKSPKMARIQSLVSERIQEFVRKDRLHVCKTTKLIISHRVYDRVEKEVQNAIIHDPTKKWLDLFEKQPDIVQLRSELYEERTMLFCVDQTIKIQTESGIRIRLDLGEKIL